MIKPKSAQSSLSLARIQTEDKPVPTHTNDVKTQMIQKFSHLSLFPEDGKGSPDDDGGAVGVTYPDDAAVSQT
jgi:hypothetical protein